MSRSDGAAQVERHEICSREFAPIASADHVLDVERAGLSDTAEALGDIDRVGFPLNWVACFSGGAASVGKVSPVDEVRVEAHFKLMKDGA